MDDQLYAVAVVIAVDLLIGLQEEVLKDGGTQEGVQLAAPVVVVQDGIGMQVGADALSQLQLPVGQVLDEIVHLVGVLHVVHQSFLHGAQMMDLLEDTGSHKGSLIGLGAVNGGIHILADVPQLVGELQAGSMDIVLPVLKVLHNDLIRRMHGERAGNILGEGVGNAPAVDHVLHAALQQGLGHQVGVHQNGNSFVLVDEPVGIAAADCFAHILFCGKHFCILQVIEICEGLSTNLRWAKRPPFCGLLLYAS